MVSHRGERETQVTGEEAQLSTSRLPLRANFNWDERETSGYEAVVVAGTSYQMKEAFINSILQSGEGLTFFSNRTKHFWWKKRNEAFQAVFFFFSEHAQKLQVKSRTRTRSRPQILSSLTLIQHGSKHIFEAKWLMRESACRNFSRKNDKYPTNARVVVGGGIFPINSVKCLAKNLIVEMRAPKQVVSGQSLKSNSISVIWEKMLLPTLSLMFFTSNI